MQFSIYVKFDQSIPYEDLPNIEVFFTSEDNADGIIFKEWMEGIELTQDFDKVLFITYDCKYHTEMFQHSHFTGTINNFTINFPLNNTKTLN